MTKGRTFPSDFTQSAATDGVRPAKFARLKARARGLAGLGYALTASWVLLAAAATAGNIGLVQLLERQLQGFFFELRGPIAAPENVVILTIDEESLSQGEHYLADPERLPYLSSLQAWPWQRRAYAEVIDKLMAAGAEAVAIDVIFSDPSTYGPEDDQALQQVLQRYGDRVVLAAEYQDTEIRQGLLTRITQPLPAFRTDAASIGSINFWVEPNGKIHQLGNQFAPLLTQFYPERAAEIRALAADTPTFADRAVEVARGQAVSTQGQSIYFHGPAGTFDQVPFWYVLDPNNWNSYLQQGNYFKDKIVLIGATATLLQDFHAAPFSMSWLHPTPMAGVEIHANAVATLLGDRAIATAIPSHPWQGVVVLLGLSAAGILISLPKQPLMRFAYAGAVAIVWTGVGYALFTQSRLTIPTAVPAVALALSGCSHLIAGSASEQLKKRRLRNTLQHYAASPIVQEIISQQDDLQDLIQEREQLLFGKKLAGRYRIVKVLGSGGFSETYIAEDIQRPGNPQCVVKQLRPASNSLEFLQIARRLFHREAEALEKLGKHDQIPQLLAYFEEDEEFYLVQEFIIGHPLNVELHTGKQLPQNNVLALLQDLLPVLDFIHQNGMIHRDIKPSNIIRRQSDNKLVLIDFGVVKEISGMADEGGPTKITVGIGTQGYMPSEQCLGMPQFSSDIYAVGVTAIEALTGLPPSKMPHDPKTGEMVWQNRVEIDPQLAEILTKMVRYDFVQRYQSAAETLADLEKLTEPALETEIAFDLTGGSSYLEAYLDQLEEPQTSTMLWPEGFDAQNSFKQTNEKSET